MNIEQTYTVRANKGKARIWIEGARLAAAGFDAGATYTRIALMSATGAGIAMLLDADGAEKVSGRRGAPIIDISGSGCAPFVTGDAVRITYTAGVIRIERA